MSVKGTFLVANGCSRAQPMVGGTIPRQVDLICVRKVAACEPYSEPERSFSVVPALASLDDGTRYGS